jgi:hypothetical protein
MKQSLDENSGQNLASLTAPFRPAAWTCSWPLSIVGGSSFTENMLFDPKPLNDSQVRPNMLMTFVGSVMALDVASKHWRHDWLIGWLIGYFMYYYTKTSLRVTPHLGCAYGWSHEIVVRNTQTLVQNQNQNQFYFRAVTVQFKSIQFEDHHMLTTPWWLALKRNVSKCSKCFETGTVRLSRATDIWGHAPSWQAQRLPLKRLSHGVEGE